MRTRNIFTIRADVMFHETGYYYPTPREADAALRVVERRKLDRRGERMLIAA